MLTYLLWFVGIALVAVGLARARGPLARYRSLQATQDNLRRYDDWRGSRLAPPAGEKTGADEMMEYLRGRTLLWGALAIVGIALIALGFLVR